MQINQNKNTFYTNLAFEQAKINLGSTGPNPSVGCVVLKNNSIISSGCTSLNGRPHAEYNALNKKINFNGATIFITMEPCYNYGATPPCVNKIVKKRIKKVFFSIFDEDKKTRKLSFKKLKFKNIRVKSGFLKSYADIFYKSYKIKKKNLLPYLDAKIALSKDYYSINKKTKWITNNHSRKRVHLLRSKYDCLLSTSKSINEDNSLLNCRIEGLERKSPHVAIIDRKFILKKNIKLLSLNKKIKIYLFTTKSNYSKELYFKKKGIKIIKLKSMRSSNDFKEILYILSNFGVSRILSESGLSFLNFLLSNKFLQNLYIFKSGENLKKKGINYASIKKIKKIKKGKKIKVNLFGDSLYKIGLK